MTTGATVFIVDDDEAVRDSVKELCISVGLAGEAFASAADFKDRYDPARPGCLVLDVRMARTSGLALQAWLKEMKIAIPIVFVSAHADVPAVVEAMRNGAVGFVTKPYREQDLLENINEALARDAAVRSVESKHSSYWRLLESLTAREREVMELAVQGLQSKVIAQRLGISFRTVELHRSRLLEKLGVESMAELIRVSSERRGAG